MTGQTNQFELVALVRNSSPTPQAWPALELQLKDQSGALLVRKVFLPGEFIAQMQERKSGIAAHSEREIRILFTLAGAPAAVFQLTLLDVAQIQLPLCAGKDARRWTNCQGVYSRSAYPQK